MKLRKEHFVKLEKPELSNYTHLKCKFCTQDVECLTFICPSLRDGFEKDLKEWEQKYIKPTPKWKKFSDEEPNNGEYIYLAREHEFNNDSFFSIRYRKTSYSLGVYDYWALVEDHKESLKYFEEHQQIFEGWGFVESKSKSNPYYNGEEHFIKGVSMITTHDKGFCVSKDHVTIYYGKNGPNAVEILKLICKDNDIEL